MHLVAQHTIIDAVLDEWSPVLGAARPGYRGHTYRVYNLARRILGSESRDDELAVTSAFHDIGIWTDRTFDYIEPSVSRAVAYLEGRAPELSVVAIERMIRNHHQLLRVRSGPHVDAVEAFRRADLVDLTRGWVRSGVDRGFLEELVAAFPYAGFHGNLVRTALRWFAKHPLRPLPMVRLLPESQRDART
jgi:hypothetical protein